MGEDDDDPLQDIALDPGLKGSEGIDDTNEQEHSEELRRRSSDLKLPAGPSWGNLAGNYGRTQVLFDDRQSSRSLLSESTAGDAEAFNSYSFFELWEMAPKRLKLLIVLFAVLSFSLLVAVIALLTNLQTEAPSHLPTQNELAPGFDSNELYYNRLTTQPPLQPLDLARADRLSDAVISPSERLLVFCRRVWNVERNTSTTILFLKDLTKPEAEPTQLTPPAWGVTDSNPNWSPDSKYVLFLSNRKTGIAPGAVGAGDLTQIWQIRIRTGEMRMLSDFAVDVDNLLLARSGRVAAFSAMVYPGLSMRATAERDRMLATAKLQQRTFEKLMVRHWDRWTDGKRSHLFLSFIEYTRQSGFSTIDRSFERANASDQDVPSFDGDRGDWSFSADDRWFSFTVHEDDNTTAHAFSTNLNVHALSIDVAKQNISGEICVTCANLAQDTGAQFGRRSNRLAVLSMSTPGYESDKQRLVVYADPQATAEPPVVLVADWPLSAKQLIWNANTTLLYAVAADSGRDCVFSVGLYTGESEPRRLFCGGSVHLVNLTSEDDLIFLMSSFLSPAEIFSYSTANDAITPLTSYAEALRTKVTFSPQATRISFNGANNDTIWGWYIPATELTNEGGKKPLAVLIHGGPQGSWIDGWSYRWNPYVFSAQGFAVVMFDVHGSFGYGQPFVDSIRGDYGGAPYEDILLGIDWLLQDRADDLDPDNICALGASYGGYMINWINGHTNRFRSLVVHDGIFSLTGLYYETDELWFPTHDQYGPPWVANPESPCYPETCYSKWDPARFIDQWQTPTLIIHGGHDYRIPDTHGMSAFTALQAKNIDSKLIIFPTENHWVLNPVDSMYWHQQVFDWILRFASR